MDTASATSLGNENTLVAASFITEVLASAGRLEKDDLNAKLGKLFRRIDEVKAEVYEAIESEYEHFLPYLHVAPDLSDRVDHFYADVGEVTDKLQTEMKTQLNSSTTEFQELSQKLGEASHMSSLLKYLVELHDLEKSAWSALEQGDYSTAGKQLHSMEAKLNEISKDAVYGNCEIQVLTALSLSCRKHLDSLESSLFESWGNHIKWSLPSQQKDSNKQSSSVALAIQSSEEAKASLTNTVQALHQLDLLEPKVNVFAKRVMEYVVRPIIIEKKQVSIRETSSLGSLTMELRLKKRDKRSDPTIEQAFDVLKSSLTFLNEHLFSIRIGEGEESKPLMALMEQFIGEDLLKLIIEHCLAPSIPTSKKDLEVFNVVVNATESLQNTLSGMELISASENSLIDYVQSVNMLFANKKCQGILTKARELMRSDIHDTVKVCPENPHQEVIDLLPDQLKKVLQASKEEKTASNLAMASDVKLSADTFRLPTCRISLSTQQLVKLAYEVMYEATQSDEACALQLFSTVRQMFKLYVAVVPTYHKDSLSKLPQLAALHHNNCMYVAHHLLLLKHQFNTKLPEALRVDAADFVDMVPGVRRTGTDCFLKTMTAQKNQLIEYLAAVNGFAGVSEESNRKIADQAIAQVFHQLRLLSNVWRGVLPQNIYSKSLGTLLQSVIKEVIDSIVALDDISADDGTELAALLGVFVVQAPALFAPRSEDEAESETGLDDEMEVTFDDKSTGDDISAAKNSQKQDKAGLACLMKNVPRWGQLLELRLVLDAGLQEVADRWADAKGPLAVQFSANEVKRLIRALFQNTDRRAAVLATIRQPVKN